MNIDNIKHKLLIFIFINITRKLYTTIIYEYVKLILYIIYEYNQ
jgi:hypothetical protein